MDIESRSYEYTTEEAEEHASTVWSTGVAPASMTTGLPTTGHDSDPPIHSPPQRRHGARQGGSGRASAITPAQFNT